MDKSNEMKDVSISQDTSDTITAGSSIDVEHTADSGMSENDNQRYRQVSDLRTSVRSPAEEEMLVLRAALNMNTR